MSRVYEEIHHHVQALEIIDTHEHLPAFENLRDKDTDVLKEYLSHYLSSDLISAGLQQEEYEKVIDHRFPLMDRWKRVEPYWDAARHTGYARALDRSVRELYGVEEISGKTIEELNAKFLKSLKPGTFERVLKRKSKIKVGLLHDITRVNDLVVFDSNLRCDQEFFRNVYPVDRLIFPQSVEDIDRFERECGARIHRFGDYLEVAETVIDSALEHGAVALKSGLAYVRPLSYERVTLFEAEQEFNRIFAGKHMNTYLPGLFMPGKKLQDYMMHHILGLAGKRKLTIQIHTGIQEGSGNYLHHSNPELLSNLFLEYPDVDFDIFHMGYPYQDELSVLAKNFANVFIDMCWAHIISPSASVNALVNWIDCVPVNKISAFGGDYLFVDGVYGHQAMARENVSAALTRKVEAGIMDVDRAKRVSEMLFYENPLRIFKLQGKIR
jgi:hypothetical protein